MTPWFLGSSIFTNILAILPIWFLMLNQFIWKTSVTTVATLSLSMILLTWQGYHSWSLSKWHGGGASQWDLHPAFCLYKLAGAIWVLKCPVPAWRLGQHSYHQTFPVTPPSLEVSKVLGWVKELEARHNSYGMKGLGHELNTPGQVGAQTKGTSWDGSARG